MAHPNRVYALADSVEVLVHNPGPRAVPVTISTALVARSGRSPQRVLLVANVDQTPAAITAEIRRRLGIK